VDGSLELVGFIPEFTSDINICSSGSHGKTDDESTFDELVRLVSENFSIFTGSWLGLVSIDNEV
jgi:hypothetical protein